MRQTILLNDGWKFLKADTKNGKPPFFFPKKWEDVTLPHTWNALDGQDGGGDYRKAPSWYAAKVKVADTNGGRAFLEFNGVNAIADVFVNGKKTAHHEGGFSTFRCDITDFLKKGTAYIAVRADNSINDYIYPQMADFTFFGGIYRDVKLIIVPESHFDLEYFGTPGVSATPVLNEDGSADIKIVSYIKNPKKGQKLHYAIDGAHYEDDVFSKGFTVHMENPHLWNGRLDPHLYTLTASLIDENNKTADAVSVKFGVRSFSIDPEKGFLLNGKSYPLHGVSRHQDRENMGWAITEKEHREDMELIAEVGANTIRLAHYQHAPYFYDLCDEYGMVVWAEIPFISQFLKGERARANTLSQMKELVLQNYNHPSIVCWGIANEITIGGESDELLSNLRALNELCHTLDKTRLTTLANLTMVEMDSPCNFITDILSYNHYFGWYFGEVEENAPWLDEFHKTNPTRALGLSEYGCEGITTLHTDAPKKQDYTEEYQAYYHEKMLETFRDRPYLWSTHVWNMFDFASDMRDEGGVKGRNNKGLVTFDRKIRKDSFYIYKAYWTDAPFVHICSKRFKERVTDTMAIKVYSNLPEVTLFVNGTEFGTVKADKIFVFQDVPVTAETAIRAVSGEAADEAVFLRVDTLPESYALPENESSTKNWFEGDGEMEPLEFPDGYFSVRDKIGDIMKTPEGEQFIADKIALAAEMANMTVSKSMISMAKGFTVERIFGMAGDRVPKKLLGEINKELNQIRKP